MKYYLYLSLWKEHEGAPGIALYELDSETGKAAFIRKLDDRTSFGCSYIDREKSLIYLCNETDRIWGLPCNSGRIYVYRIDPADGSLTEVSHTDTYCSNPCYIYIDKDRRFAAVANYGQSGFFAEFVKKEDGTFVPELRDKKSYLQIYRLNDDGALGELTDVIEHEYDLENSPLGSNVHCVQVSPDGRFMAVTCKGNGRLYLYRIDTDTLTLSLCSSIMTEEGGASPRYALFHPTLPLIICNQEKEKHGHMKVSSFAFDTEGALTKISTVNVLPEGFEIPKGAHFEQQGMAISADGRYVYSCLKGPEIVCVMEISEDAALSVIQQVPLDGEWPRGLAITPDGKCLAVSAHCSGEVNIYLIQKNGTLERTDIVHGPVGGSNMSFYAI